MKLPNPLVSVNHTRKLISKPDVFIVEKNKTAFIMKVRALPKNFTAGKKNSSFVSLIKRRFFIILLLFIAVRYIHIVFKKVEWNLENS